MRSSRGIGGLGPFILVLLMSCGDGTDDTATDVGPIAGQVSCAGQLCTLSGTYTDELTLTKDKQWLLRGGVFIGDDDGQSVLNIEPGTTVFGETSSNGMLVIRRGSKIMADGTREEPIVFTSSKPVGSRARGDWGGVIINGRAKVNACGDEEAGACESFGEGGTGFFGGSDDDDDSGVMRYVRIEFAGRLISPDNELNGLALQAVGRATTLEKIQLHMVKDDGVEFFGGSASFKYILVTGAADDNLDWTDGWRGKGQFFVAQQYEDAGDNGIEADNNAESNGAAPRSQPTLSNVTLIGSPDSKMSDLGVLLREGTAANISNLIATSWNEACLDIDHDETFANALDGEALSGELTLTASIIDCATPFVEQDEDAFAVSDFFDRLNAHNQQVSSALRAPLNVEDPDFRPADGSPAVAGAAVPADPFFEQVSFIGGVDPASDWTEGWTTSARN